MNQNSFYIFFMFANESDTQFKWFKNGLVYFDLKTAAIACKKLSVAFNAPLHFSIKKTNNVNGRKANSWLPPSEVQNLILKYRV